MTPTSFGFDVAPGGVATVTFDRPERLNALTFGVYRELSDLFAALQRDDDVRAVVVTGSGRAFCSGGDVHEIIGELIKMAPPELLAFTRTTGELILRMRRLRKPIVAAVNGVAAGAGAVIALASDFRIMAQDAKLAFLFVRVGLAGADMGAAFLLPRIVGLGRATELLMLGDSVSATRCADVGLANQVLPLADVLPAARALAERLARGPGFALAMTKELLDRELSMTLEQAIEAEAQGQQICMLTRDFREAFEAFAARREPRFEGR
jgi:enoyl-CoA hydratase/carnithine racemase